MRVQSSEILGARRLSAVLAALALVALAAACELDGASKRRAEEAQRRQGSWTQPDGRRASLEELRGQVVVLDFWATYCPPCREEIPHLVRLQKRFGPQGFKVIGLNVGGEDDRPKVPDFVREFGIEYQLAEPDPETTRRFLADDNSIPQTFIIDRSGRLVEHVTGYDAGIAGKIDRAVAQALAETAD